MKRILITGATGNIGREVIQHLMKLNSPCQIIAAVRNLESEKQVFTSGPNLSFRQFDFENTQTHQATFDEIDVLFLLRPPQL